MTVDENSVLLLDVASSLHSKQEISTVVVLMKLEVDTAVGVDTFFGVDSVDAIDTVVGVDTVVKVD